MSAVKTPKAPSRAVGKSKKQALRRTVLEAAAELFAHRGFGGTNLQDIADALELSRPALYYYFKSKEEMLSSLLEEVTVFSGRQATSNTHRRPGRRWPAYLTRHVLLEVRRGKHPKSGRVDDQRSPRYLVFAHFPS